jgi:hypothetical protein
VVGGGLTVLAAPAALAMAGFGVGIAKGSAAAALMASYGTIAFIACLHVSHIHIVALINEAKWSGMELITGVSSVYLSIGYVIHHQMDNMVHNLQVSSNSPFPAILLEIRSLLLSLSRATFTLSI